MSIQLFPDTFDRTKLPFILPGESLYGFYCRKRHPQLQRAKETLQADFDALPQIIQIDLSHNLMSDRDENHSGAMFEWFCYRLFTRLGYSVEWKPSAGDQKTPDLLLRWHRKPVAYVECTVLREEQPYERDSAAIDRLFYEAKRYCRFVGYSVETKSWKVGSHYPSPRDFARFMDRAAESLRISPSKVNDTEPKVSEFVFEDASGWQVVFALRPCCGSATSRQRLESVRHQPMRRILTRERMQKRIDEKRRHYQSLDAPLIVAASLHDEREEDDPFTVGEALLGQSQAIFDIRPFRKVETTRVANGVWYDAHSGNRSKPDMVITTGRCSVWKWHDLQPSAWYNPFGSPPMRLPVWPYAEYIPNHELQRLEKYVGGVREKERIG